MVGMRFLPAVSLVALTFFSLNCTKTDEGPIEAKLLSITISEMRALETLETLELAAIGTFDDGTTPDLSTQVTWSSSDKNIATIEGRMLRAVAEGTSEITATFNGVTSKSTLTVKPLVVKEIVLSTNEVTIARGETVNLNAIIKWSNKTEEEGTTKVTWSSSAPRVLSVDAEGLVTGLAGGEATITATHEGVSSTATVFSTCSYLEDAGDTIDFGITMPNMYWSDAFDKAGEPISISMEDVYCSAEWNDVTALFFVLSTGWCPYCPDYMRNIAAQIENIEAAGGRMILVEVQDNAGAPGDSSDALHWLEMIVGRNVAMGVGDRDVDPSGIWGRSPLLVAFPSTLVVRKHDMKLIADQMRANNTLPFATIANNVDLDWSDPDNVEVQNCEFSDAETAEPNDRPGQAERLEPGTINAGVCSRSDEDYYQISIEGAWRLTMEFRAYVDDLNVYVWDDANNRILEIDGEKVGSYGTTGLETFEHSGPAMIRVESADRGTAPYALTLEAL
jgi:hypothetical protein